jgi:L-2-hydroxyglutarate oxidase
MQKIDVVVIGGGIVGLSSALNILKQRPGLSLYVCEKEVELACHQTGHNSGVIHSGIYYKPGSLKAQTCLSGYQQLIAFCREESIAYDICGKLIVATQKEQLPVLQQLFERAQAHGLVGVKKLSKEGMKDIEPHVAGIEGLYIPQTGIIDYKAVALGYAKKIGQLGGRILTQTQVLKAYKQPGGIVVITSQGEFLARSVINCAGLYSDKVAARCAGPKDVAILPFRGEYYQLKPASERLVKNLIYPVPNPQFPFLGVHFTRMITGGVEAGPNAVLALKKEGYSKWDFSFKEALEILLWPGFRKMAQNYWKMGLEELYRSMSKKAFTQALQKLIPDIQMDDLIPAPAGVRAQASSINGGLVDDFLIRHTPGFIHVLNAPSPAATASMAIGQKVAFEFLSNY